MHESGLVEELIDELRRVAEKNGGGRISRVQVGIGVQAGFSPGHFEEHFYRSVAGTQAAEAELEVEMRPGDALTLEAVEIEDA